MGPLRRVADWLDSRTGFRAGRSHLLDEPLPAGVGWWFVTGSILLFLLGVQLITGVVLTMYYVPSPEHAYDSVRYITDRLPLGRDRPRPALLRRELHRHRRGDSHAARGAVRLVQEAARSDVDDRRRPAAAHPRRSR